MSTPVTDEQLPSTALRERETTGSAPVPGSEWNSPASKESHATEAPVGHTVKETITSIIIAFVMAFVFRGFVIEAFLIPTGSMAPTLLGAHMRFTSPQSGYSWAVGPWDMKADQLTPEPIQGGPSRANGEPDFEHGQRDANPVVVHDPMTGYEMRENGIPIRWGDRIFVLKYLYSVYDPQRFDVVVFKNPRDPTVNFIKRLIGLPGEQIALVDGDVFARKPDPSDDAAANPWSLPGWRICRKPERAQRAVWQSLFSSEEAPRDDGKNAGRTWFVSPWVPVGTGEKGDEWKTLPGGEYEYTGAGLTHLAWNSRTRPIVDSYAYNECPTRISNEFPVSDLRMTAGWEPKSQGERMSAVLEARGHTFRITISEGRVALEMGAGQGEKVEYQPISEPRTWSPIVGRVNNLDFWFVDQTLQFWCDGERIAYAEYNWSPAERVQYALRADVDSVAAGPEYLTVEGNYVRPEPFFEFSGGPFTLHNVGLARDIHYQAAMYSYHGEDDSVHSRARRPALATHPTSTLSLTGEEFFCCGDNSPQSLDGRLWDAPHPWVAQIDPDLGVVHRDLLIGKAFFVYFPAPYRLNRLPVPDFGRMRWIW